MVQEQHSYPIFAPDWGADEELLLISGLMKDGLGNWAEAAAHIGTRTKEDCEKHYLEVYLGVGSEGEDLGQTANGVDTEAEPEPPRKKQRREFMPVSCIKRTVVSLADFASQWTWTSRSTTTSSRK